MAFSLAALLVFYRPDRSYPITDEPDVLEFLADRWRDHERSGDVLAFSTAVLSRRTLWGEDLTTVPALAETTARSVGAILSRGMRRALEDLLEGAGGSAPGGSSNPSR